MGILGSIIGLDQQKQAQNAVLASHLLETVSIEAKMQIAMGLMHVLTQGSRNPLADVRKEFTELSTCSRVIQMNFVALACGSQNILPAVKGAWWELIRNPYIADNRTTLGYIPIVINTIAKRDGVRVSWPGNDCRENFAVW